jgi:hypothetical protein
MLIQSLKCFFLGTFRYLKSLLYVSLNDLKSIVVYFTNTLPNLKRINFNYITVYLFLKLYFCKKQETLC